jgi:hypothetical protein
VLEFLYVRIGMPENQGFIVALGSRIVMFLIATVGGIYYLVGRREVQAVIYKIRDQQPLDAAAPLAQNERKAA